jgi:integrase
MSIRTPKYRLHRGSGQALVCLSGRRIYLVTHGTEESKAKYRRVVAEWLATGAATRPAAALTKPDAPTRRPIGRPSRRWHCEGYYQSGYVAHCRAAMLALDELYGDMDAAAFGTVQFDAVIAALVTKGLSRGYINQLAGTVRRCFKWAARKGLIPVATWHHVQLVEGLRKGRTEAYEPDDVGPVSESDVQATLPFLPSVVADMVRLQRLLGCRPGELVQMRPADIDMSGEVWFFSPRTHKNAYRDKPRRILIGPRGQAILRPYLLRAGDSHCFRPADSERKRHVEQRERRKTRVQPSQAKRRPKAKPKRAPGEFYTVASYRQAIERAAGRADVQAHREQPAVKAETRIVAQWRPNQLRHSAASEVRREFGLEAAQVLLGHTRADVTQVYAQRNDALAAQIAARMG